MATKPLVILCVEDDDDNASIVELSLALDTGLRVRFATSGEAALAMLESGLRPDLILLDVRLPGMDGIAVAQAVAARYPAVDRRIVFMTAAVRIQQLAEMRATGHTDVIAKPFDPLTLAQRVRTAATRISGNGDASELGVVRS